MTSRRPRELLPDALRALALGGVLLVNVLGYRDVPYGRLLGQALPPGSDAAQGVIFVVAAVVQGKAYPVLALLFGIGLAYAARGSGMRAAVQAADRRNARLLMLGVAHGMLLYYGDILTMYALGGFWVARQMREPWHAFGRRLRRAVGWALLAIGGSLALALLPLGEPDSLQTIGTVRGYREFFALNATTYLSGVVFGVLLALPLIRLCMLAGVAVVRLRLLTHARWRVPLRVMLRRWLWLVLAANLVYAAAYVGWADARAAHALESASALWCVPLAACWLALAALAWHGGLRRWLFWLAPLGQHTLSVYLAASLTMAFVLSGAGAGVRPSTSAAAACALASWCGAALASRWLRGRWPAEAWMARR